MLFFLTSIKLKTVLHSVLMNMVVRYELVKRSMRWTENWLNNQAYGRMISGKRSSWRLVTSALPQFDIWASAV